MFLLSLLLSGVLATTPATPEVAVPSERDTCILMPGSIEDTVLPLDIRYDLYNIVDDESSESVNFFSKFDANWKRAELNERETLLLNCLKKRCSACSTNEILRTFMATEHFKETREPGSFMYDCTEKYSVPGRLLDDLIDDGIEAAKKFKRLYKKSTGNNADVSEIKNTVELGNGVWKRWNYCQDEDI